MIDPPQIAEAAACSVNSHTEKLHYFHMITYLYYYWQLAGNLAYLPCDCNNKIAQVSGVGWGVTTPSR
jgi:hypothetical protein